MKENKKGYKVFEKEKVCRGFQYAENDGAPSLSQSDFHFWENPLDVLSHYPLLDNNCDLVEIAEVEALGDIAGDDTKIATNHIKIGNKLDLPSFTNHAFNFLQGNAMNTITPITGRESLVASSGDNSRVATDGDYSKVVIGGIESHVATSGDYSQVAISGNRSQVATSGDFSQVAISGSTRAATSGWKSQVVTSGDNSQVATSGNLSKVVLTGLNNVGANIGDRGMIKGVKGSWIALAEYKEGVCVCIKSAMIDGLELKENTFYTLKNKCFVEICPGTTPNN